MSPILPRLPFQLPLAPVQQHQNHDHHHHHHQIIKSSNHQIIIVTIIMITIIMITIIIIITNLALPVMAKPGESSKRRGNTSTKTRNLTCPALVNADGYYCADFEIANGAA